MKPQCVFVGTVKRVSQQTSQRSGKPYAALTIEGPAIQYGEGKQFRVRVDVVCYRDPGKVSTLRAGTLVCVKGDGEAKAYEYQGKWHAKLTITGDVIVLEDATGEEPAGQQEFETQPAQTRRPASTTKPATPDDDDDDVPF